MTDVQLQRLVFTYNTYCTYMSLSTYPSVSCGCVIKTTAICENKHQEFSTIILEKKIV